MTSRIPLLGIDRCVGRSWYRCIGLMLIFSSAVAAEESRPQPPAHDPGLEIPAVEHILATLRPAHPRVMAGPETFAELKVLIDKGGVPAQIYSAVKKSAVALLEAPVSKYEKPDGRRLLRVSRRVLDRVRTLAMVFRLEGDSRYADRAWRELQAAAAFPDWNPAHFLDTAEMTHAFALGYDWLYDCWSENQRRTLRQAIVAKGLREGLAVYRRKKGWPRNENNWNQVCNGGLISGALAVADVEPEIAAQIVHYAAHSVPLAMRHYAPDGGGTEGVTYWDYGSRYNIVLLSSLETALGTDFGLSRAGAFDRSGYYQIYLSGAGRVAFDFADCGRSRVSEAQHFWMARKYDIPAYRWFRRSALQDGERGGTLDLLWYDDRDQDVDVATLPLDRYFRGAECVSLRSSWQPDALIVGVQAGNSMNLRGHRHLDLGSFIVDARGERWITDSGVEHETYMAHRHHNPRYAYYRVRAEGHNVPVFNPGPGPDQNPKAVAKIVQFESTPRRATASVDLTQAYQPHVEQAQRTYLLEDRRQLVVTDELHARQPSELWWFLHTEAQVTLSDEGRTATLSQHGKTFAVRLQEPGGVAFQVMDCRPLPTSPNPEPQASNRDRRKLALHWTQVRDVRIVVSLE